MMPQAFVRGWVRRVAVAVAVALSACGRPVEDPSGQEDIYLHADIDHTVIAAGEVATLTFRLESVATAPVVLEFTTGCQIMPYVAEADTGAVVYPEDGTWVCTMALTTIELPPGGTEVRELRVRAGAGEREADVALPPGHYLAYARLDDQVYQLVSTSLRFTVQ